MSIITTKVLNLKGLLNSAEIALNSGVGFACTGWDTCPASLAPLASLALKVLLNAAQKIFQEFRFRVPRRSFILISRPQKSVFLQGTLVGHPRLKDLSLGLLFSVLIGNLLFSIYASYIGYGRKKATVFFY